MHGHPHEILDVGSTAIPEDVFRDYLTNISPLFTADKYHLLDHNCNTFTGQVIEFLCNGKLPEHIANLPADFLSTPFGHAMRPFLENIFGPSRHPAPPSSTITASTTQANQVSSAVQPLVRNVTSVNQVQSVIKENRAVILYLTSQTCPPCRVIHPEYEKLIKSQTLGPKTVVGLIADASRGAQSIFLNYEAHATPTFVLFLDGKEFHRFSGANLQELKSSLNLLQFTAWPRKCFSFLNASMTAF